MPEKSPVQETVSALKNDQSLKTTIGVDAELPLPILHCGTHEAFLMHVSTALNAIEKWGTFKAYKEACEAYVEQHKAVNQAKAALALLTAPRRRRPGRTALRKRRLLRRPRKAQLWLMHQPQNCAWSIRPTTTKQVCRRDHQEQAQSHCYRDVSVLPKLAVFGCQVLVEQDSPGTDGG